MPRFRAVGRLWLCVLAATSAAGVAVAAAAEGISANSLLTTFVAEGVAVRVQRSTVGEPKAPRYKVAKRASRRKN